METFNTLIHDKTAMMIIGGIAIYFIGYFRGRKVERERIKEYFQAGKEMFRDFLKGI